MFTAFAGLCVFSLSFILILVAMVQATRMGKLRRSMTKLENRLHQLETWISQFYENGAIKPAQNSSYEQKNDASISRVSTDPPSETPEENVSAEESQITKPPIEEPPIEKAPVVENPTIEASDDRSPEEDTSTQSPQASAFDLANEAQEIPEEEKPKEEMPEEEKSKTQKEEKGAVESEEPPKFDEPLPPESQSNHKPQRNLEEFLGGQLFLKIGVGAVVMGMVFFLAYAMAQMGALGKILMGFFIGGSGFAGGLVLERQEKYLQFGRSIIAGSLAILFFVVFAAHYVPAARLITSPLYGNLFLFLTAIGVVAFSLRYNHEWTTCSAFILIFLTLIMAAVHGDVAFNLTAIDVVTAGVCVLALKKSWWRLLLFGTGAAWLALYVWIVPNTAGTFLESMYGSATNKSGLSVVLLLVSTLIPWVCFQLTCMRALPDDERFKKWVVIAFLINFAGGFGLTLFEVHKIYPGQTWLLALFFGIAYLLVAWWLSKGNQRNLYLISATIGIGALALVTPLRLGLGHRAIPLFRMVGIEVVLAAGVFTKEKYFRDLAYAAFTFTFLEIFSSTLDTSTISIGGFFISFQSILLTGMVMVSGINTYLFRTSWQKALEDWEVPSVAYAFSTFTTLGLALLSWYEMPLFWESVSFAALSLVWVFLAWRKKLSDLLVQGVFFFIMAVITASIQNMPAAGVSRWLPILLCSIFLFAAHYFLEKTVYQKDRVLIFERRFHGRVIHKAILGIFLLFIVCLGAVCIKLEMTAQEAGIFVAPVFGLASVLLIERGRLNQIWTWPLVGIFMFLVGWAHLFIENIEVGSLIYSTLTFLPYAGMAAYLHSTWPGSTSKLSVPESTSKFFALARPLFSTAVVHTLATFSLRELQSAYVVASWAAMATILVARWVHTKEVSLNFFALLMCLATVVRAFGANLLFRNEPEFLHHNLLPIPITCLLLAAAFVIVHRWQLSAEKETDVKNDFKDSQISAANKYVWFFSTVSIFTGFLWVESKGTGFTTMLSIWALCIVVAGFGLKDKPIRWTGLTHLLFCIVKLFVYDLSGLTGLTRVFSFIGLGAVLIIVSFVYTKFSERIEEMFQETTIGDEQEKPDAPPNPD